MGYAILLQPDGRIVVAGTGGYYNDLSVHSVYDPATSSLELVPLFAYYVGFGHGWSPTLSSAILYSALEVDHLESQPADGAQEGVDPRRLLRARPFLAADQEHHGVVAALGGVEDGPHGHCRSREKLGSSRLAGISPRRSTKPSLW